MTRGICNINNGILTGINETRNIVKTEMGAEADGKSIDVNALVSMNFWCYPLDIFGVLRSSFKEFLTNMKNPLEDEYLLPIVADAMIKNSKSFSVISNDDKWFGVTYKEDKKNVMESFRKLIEQAVYKSGLYSDLKDMVQ